MSSRRIPPTSFELTGPGSIPVSGRVLYDTVTSTAIFTPDSELMSETTYTATITTGALDLAGNPLDDDYVWTFDVPDVIAPYVIETDPEDGAFEVAVDAEVYATFSEAMNPLTIRPSTFTLIFLIDAACMLIYDVGLQTAIFTPDSELEAESTYTATITTGVWDLAGNPLEEDYVWTFTVPDQGAPTVLFTVPEDGEGGTEIDATVNATFSEDMDPLTILSSTFTVTGPGTTPLSGVVTGPDRDVHAVLGSAGEHDLHRHGHDRSGRSGRKWAGRRLCLDLLHAGVAAGRPALAGHLRGGGRRWADQLKHRRQYNPGWRCRTEPAADLPR